MIKKTLFIITLLLLGTARTAFADNPIEKTVTIDEAGYVTGSCDGINMYGITTYRGTYPDDSVQVATIGPTGGQVCSLIFPNGIFSMEGGYANGAGSTPDGEYWVKYTLVQSAGLADFTGNWYYWTSTRSGGIWGNDNSTRFTSYTLSTSTQEFIVTGYINPSDSDVRIVFNVSTPVYSQWDNDTFIATTSGNFYKSFIYQNFSTSTLDHYTFKATLLTPSTDPFSAFTVPVIYDEVSTTTDANGIGLTRVPPPAEIDEIVGEVCNPFGHFFSAAHCVSALIFPNADQVNQNVITLREKFLTKLPLGYVTRMYDILRSNATTTIPSISYTWEDDGGPLGGKTWTIDVDDYMVQAKGLTDEMVSNKTGNHKTAWQIMEPLIDLFLAIFVFYNILHDIMGIKLHKEPKT